ncbi:MAG: ATP-binding cassette domain-containing protein [Cyanobacteriota bacterium ELA615]
MSIIEVSNLSKIYPVAIKEPGFKGTLSHFFQRKYRQIKAVEGVSFTLNQGEIVGFLGPNGAGKTTTLKMLTGLIHPSSGNVQVAGYTPYRRQKSFLNKISLVMGQKQQLLWDLPALDSLKINAAIYNIPDKVFKTRLDELATMLSLEEQLTQPIRKLSLGQRMKAELLAALIHHPQILFLDEPTLGLDVNAQAAVREFLRDYNTRYQSTIILTSHYMADIVALCPRILIINQGILVYDGELDKLLKSFADYRQVKIDLGSPLERKDLEKYGEISSIEGKEVCFSIPFAKLTSTITLLLEELDILDFSVQDPPVEEIISHLFTQGNLN